MPEVVPSILASAKPEREPGGMEVGIVKDPSGLESALFEDQRSKRDDPAAANEEELYEQIGRLKMEVEWLKKKAAELS